MVAWRYKSLQFQMIDMNPTEKTVTSFKNTYSLADYYYHINTS